MNFTDYYTELTTTGANVEYPTQDDYRCSTKFEITSANAATYLGFIVGAPLHAFIICRLVTNISTKRAYHYFIILQSVDDLIKISYGPLFSNMVILINVLNLYSISRFV